MRNNLNQKALVEISVKYGPSFQYQLPDSYIKFNEDLYKMGYPLSKSELSYINSNNKKIILKSKNDFISLLRYVRSVPNKIKLFYEKEVIDSFINDFQFEEIKNVYSDLDIGHEQNLDISEMKKNEQTYNTINTLNTINEIVDNIDKGALYQGIKLIINIFKKKCYNTIMQYISKKYDFQNYNKIVDMNKIPNNKISESLKLEYKLPSIENLLNNNNMDLFQNNNNDILSILTSHFEKIENNINNNIIFQTMINNSKISKIKKVNTKINKDKNLQIIQSEVIQSPLKVHFGIKCNNCNIKPIKNKRYKCPKCLNYNLCEICEEKNSTFLFHPHTNFILIRNPENNFTDNPYSYQCLTKNLVFNIKKGDNINNDKIVINNILIKNNYLLPWPGSNRTLFKCDKSLSTIFCEKIFLPPLVLGSTTNIEFVFKKANKIPKGNYKCILNFMVNNDKYGEPLELSINLI